VNSEKAGGNIVINVDNHPPIDENRFSFRRFVLGGGNGMLWKERNKKKSGGQGPAYDKTGKKPVIRASICTGEKVAGFRDEKTGRIEELMLIAGEKDLAEFLDMYGVRKEEIETIW